MMGRICDSGNDLWWHLTIDTMCSYCFAYISIWRVSRQCFHTIIIVCVCVCVLRMLLCHNVYTIFTDFIDIFNSFIIYYSITLWCQPDKLLHCGTLILLGIHLVIHFSKSRWPSVHLHCLLGVSRTSFTFKADSEALQYQGHINLAQCVSWCNWMLCESLTSIFPWGILGGITWLWG